MSVPFSIAIKTHERAPTLAAKTLALLARHDISSRYVTLFVASEQQRQAYRSALADFHGDMVVTGPGIKAAVTAIRCHYPHSTAVLHCDDDLMDLLVAGEDGKLHPIRDLGPYVETMFAMTRASRCALWSIYAVANSFFMQNAVVAGLRFCSGCFHGFISDAGQDPWLLPTVAYKDDVEASIRYFVKYGAVIRDERVAPKTQYFKTGGGGTAGTGHEERTERHIADARALAAQWPALCRVVKKKNFGGTDVRLNAQIRPTMVGPSPAKY